MWKVKTRRCKRYLKAFIHQENILNIWVNNNNTNRNHWSKLTDQLSFRITFSKKMDWRRRSKWLIHCTYAATTVICKIRNAPVNNLNWECKFVGRGPWQQVQPNILKECSVAESSHNFSNDLVLVNFSLNHLWTYTWTLLYWAGVSVHCHFSFLRAVLPMMT